MSLGRKIALFAGIAISVALIGCSIVGMFLGENPLYAVSVIVLTCLIIFYAFVGYKKPHGNLLRIIMAVFALGLVLALLLAIELKSPTVTIVFIPISMAIIAYISGRLNKSWENGILAFIVFVLLAHISISPIVKFAPSGIEFYDVVLYISPLLIWTVLCGAYFTRLEEHVEASK